MLRHRDEVAEQVVINGDQEAESRADAIDYRFLAITEEGPVDEHRRIGASGWWWFRVPSDPESRCYLGSG